MGNKPRVRFSIVKALLKAGADVNAIAIDGTTAVMLTADAEADDRWRYSRSRNGNMPDVTRKDWRGRSVVDEARDKFSLLWKTGDAKNSEAALPTY